MTERKQKTFVQLMVKHVKHTIEYVEAAFKSDSGAKDTAFKNLVDNIMEWSKRLSTREVTQKKWIDLFKAHTLAAAAYAEAVLFCDCCDLKKGHHNMISAMFGHCEKAQKGQKAYADLINNQKEIVAFLANLSTTNPSKELNKHWSAHLTCTANYICTLAYYRDIDSDEYTAATYECQGFARNFGAFMQTTFPAPAAA